MDYSNLYQLDDGKWELDTNAVVDSMDMIKENLELFSKKVIAEAEKRWQRIVNEETMSDKELDKTVEEIQNAEFALSDMVDDDLTVNAMFWDYRDAAQEWKNFKR